MISLLFGALAVTLAFFAFMAWKFITKQEPLLETNSSFNDLVETIVNEINTALSLNQTEVIHRFNPSEPPIDGEIAANVTFKVARSTPCVVLLYYETNGDVRIVLQRM